MLLPPADVALPSSGEEPGIQQSGTREGITCVAQRPPSSSADWTQLQLGSLQVSAAKHAACLHIGMTGRRHSLVSQQQAVRLQVCHGMHQQTRPRAPCTWERHNLTGAAPLTWSLQGFCHLVNIVPAAPSTKQVLFTRSCHTGVKQCSSSLLGT